MIKLFKNTVINKFVSPKQKEKSVNEMIDEIHETFYTEVDRLLKEAKITNSLDTDKQDLIDKCERLKHLGFKNTKEVKDAEIEIARIDQLRKENQKKANLTKAINYFSLKYPTYKFITEESVIGICEKYNLVYGSVENYIGEVPDKNLKHIENFKVHEDDECCVYTHSPNQSYYMGREKYLEFKSNWGTADFRDFRSKMTSFRMIPRLYKCPLEIAAPIKDFNMDKMKVNNFKISKIEIPDPVVLKPVVFRDKKYYLIVTAWGQEASDELVVNERNN